MAKARIMIVEDESIVAVDLREALLALGYDVPDAVSSGKEAIEQAVALRPDLILMDIVLEGDLDGVEAAEEINSIIDIPVIYLTAYADYSTLQRAKATGPLGYLLKPYDRKTLQISIEMALGKHQMERKLRESEARYRAVVEDQTELICRFDSGLKLIFVNDACCRYFGKGREGMLGKSILHLVSEEDREKIGEIITSLCSDRPVASCEHRVLQNGSARWHRWTCRAILDCQGHISEYQSVGRDVTEERLMEDTLRESEELFRSLVDNMLDAAIIVDWNGTILFANRSALKLAGLEPQLYRDISILAMICPEQTEALIRNLEMVKNGYGGFLQEYRIRTIDGREKWVECLGTRISFRGRSADLVTMRDVTERKAAEERLRLFESAVSNASDAVMIARPDDGEAFGSSVVYVNDVFARMTGYSLQEAVGKDPSLLLGGVDNVKESMIIRARLTGSPISLEIESKSKDGRPFWSSFNLFPIKDRKGRITHWGSIQRDITEKKDAEARLQWSEALLRSMAENSPLAFYVVDDRTDSILYHNRLFGRIWGMEDLDDGISSRAVKNRDVIFRITHLIKDPTSFIESLELLEDENNRSALEDEINLADGRIIRRFSTQIRDLDDSYFGRLYIFEDITERRKSERALSDSEERFRTLAVSSPVGIFRTDDKGKYIYVNDRWCEISGLSHPEAMGDGWKEGLCSDDRERIERSWPPDNKIFRSEYRFKRPDGGDTWVLGQAVAEVTPSGDTSSGDVSGYMGTITDITYRKQLENELFESNKELERRVEERTEKLAKASSKLVKAYQEMMVDLEERRQIEERLRKSNARYRAIVEDQSELVCRFLLDGTLTYANEAFCRSVGKSYDDLIGQSFIDYILEEDRESMTGLIDALSREKPFVVPGESRIRTSGGDVRWILWTTKAIFGEYGRLIELQSVGRDITSQKQWDERLRQAAQNWSSTFSSIQDGICLLDIDGTVLQCNDAMCRLLEKPSEQIIGKKCHELMHGSDSFHPQCPFKAMLLKGTRTVSEMFIGDRWFAASSDPIFDESGNIIKAVHIVREITDQKRAKEALLESEERLKMAMAAANFESAYIGIAFMDLPGKSLKVNPGIQRMLGVGDREISLGSFMDQVHSDDRDGAWNIMNEFLSGRRDGLRSVLRFVGRDGRTITGRLNACTHGRASGDHGFGVIILEDVTDLIEVKKDPKKG